MTLPILASDNDTGFVGPFARCRRRVDGDDDADEDGRTANTRRFNHAPAPQADWHVVKDLGFDLLPTEPNPLVFADDLC